MAARSPLAPCPNCGSRRRREIIYGLYARPPEGMTEDSYVLGGCVISPGHPTHECNDCQTRDVARRDDLETGERLADDTRPGRPRDE